MAKRTNRLAALDHERHQLEKLKILEPNATPDDLRALSDALIDLAVAALDEVYRLEEGKPLYARRIELIYNLAGDLPNVMAFARQNHDKNTSSKA
jgi:hypothetical protein